MCPHQGTEVNGSAVGQCLDDLVEPVKDGDELHITLMIAGG